MKPTDIIFFRDRRFGCHRFYEIVGVHLGALDQVGYIAIKPLNEKPALDDKGDVMEVMNVPEPLLRNVAIYTKDTTHDNAG